MNKKYIIWENNSKKEGIVGNIHIDNFVPACHKGKICFSKDRNMHIGIAEVQDVDERENINIVQSIHKIGTIPPIGEFFKAAERGLLLSAASEYGTMIDREFTTIRCDDIEGYLYYGDLYTMVDGIVTLFINFNDYNIPFTETGRFSMLNTALNETNVHTTPNLDVLMQRAFKYGFGWGDMVNMVSGANGTGIIINDAVLFVEVDHRCCVIKDITHHEAYWKNVIASLSLRDYVCWSQFGIMWEELQNQYTFGIHSIIKGSSRYRPNDGFAYLPKVVSDMLQDSTMRAYEMKICNKECIKAFLDVSDFFKSIGKYGIDDLNEAQEWMDKKNEDFEVHYKAAIKKGLIRPAGL